MIDAHPAVRSSVVVGRPAGQRTRHPRDVVVDTAGAALTEAELTKWVRPRLDPEKRPRTWRSVDAELRDAGQARRWAWR